METGNIIFLVVAAILLIGIGVCFYLKRDYYKYHSVFTPVISSLATCVKAISGIAPNNTAIKTLAEVLNAVVAATTLAEKLWLDSVLDKDKRNEYAQKYIEKTLMLANIEITDNIKSVINGAISFVCYLMPHGKEPKVIEEEA